MGLPFFDYGCHFLNGAVSGSPEPHIYLIPCIDNNQNSGETHTIDALIC
jgi:hypothetical protein